MHAICRLTNHGTIDDKIVQSINFYGYLFIAAHRQSENRMKSIVFYFQPASRILQILDNEHLKAKGCCIARKSLCFGSIPC